MESLAWTCAIGGLLLGGVAALIPGFPGSAVALLGLVAFASLTEFRIVTPEALAVAAVITVVGTVGQILGPIGGSRALGGSAGAATGAAFGALAGVVIPLPGASWVAAVVGAVVLGFFGSRGEWIRWLRGVAGTAGGCLVAVAADGLAVLGIGAVLGFADFWHRISVTP